MIDNPTLHQRKNVGSTICYSCEECTDSQAQPTVALRSGSVYMKCNMEIKVTCHKNYGEIKHSRNTT